MGKIIQWVGKVAAYVLIRLLAPVWTAAYIVGRLARNAYEWTKQGWDRQ